MPPTKRQNGYLDLQDILNEREVLLFDGGVGSELYNHGIGINLCFEQVNLRNPNLVRDVHLSYANAGADIITANTFGANYFKLKNFGLENDLMDINRRGIEIARESVEEFHKSNPNHPKPMVAGSIGPLGVRIEPWGPTSYQEAENAFRQQAEVQVKAGADILSLETFGDLSVILCAIRGSRKASKKIPIIAHMTIGEDGQCLYGTDPKVFAEQLEQQDIDAVGLNCSVGPKKMLDSLEKLKKIITKPICVQPNAGTPSSIDGRNIYLCSAEYLADYARKYVQSGARIVGGCCGTTPEHIKKIRETIRAVVPGMPRRDLINPKMDKLLKSKASSKEPFKKTSSIFIKSGVGQITPPEGVTPKKLSEKSVWGNKLANGEFVTTIEILPPKGCQPESMIKHVRKLKDFGIDAVNIPDGPRAVSRMGALPLAILVTREVPEVEVVLHYTCRDRNLLGIQSDLLGAAAGEVKNMLLVTGDPPKMGSLPDATAVFDIDAIGLTNMAYRLNNGYDLGGNQIGGCTNFVLGVGVNPGHHDFDYEMKRFQYKVEAGAEFAITQPVFDVDLLNRFLDWMEKAKINIPIIPGIWPLLSYRNAEFMNNEVPGCDVPDPILKRMKEAGSGDEAKLLGSQIAREILAQVRERVAGVQVSAPLNKVEYALTVLKDVELTPKPKRNENIGKSI